MNEIELYKTADGQTQVEVRFEGETVWATQKQIAELFQTTPQNITLHLKNIFAEEEILEAATCKDYLQVQNEGKRKVQRTQKLYNLDAILSVVYRINSKRGTQFRIWATQKLKEHLVQGYTINQKRLDELQKVVNIIQQSGADNLNLVEAKGLLDILGNYTQSFILLNQFDSGVLKIDGLNENVTYEIKYAEAIAA